MCGRTCLTLEPTEIKNACEYDTNMKMHKKDVEMDKKIPEWRSEFNLGRKYQPSYNIAPTDITPVLVSMDHFNNNPNGGATNERLIVPMMWGMVPFWHKGDYKKHGLSTNNCRLEHMLESKLFRGPFQKGQRCVILCEGFYEWQTTKSAKPSERSAFLLHMPQPDGIKIYDKSTWKNNDQNDDNNKKIKLLMLAGLFDIWENENGDKIYSYSAITFKSCNWMSWLHHRMPAILENDKQVADWLDFKRVSDKEALAVLKPSSKLSWHQVSNMVNNSRNKSEICNKPIEEASKNRGPKIPKSNLMKSWLLVRKRKEEKLDEQSSTEEEEEIAFHDNKRPKHNKSP